MIDTLSLKKLADRFGGHCLQGDFTFSGVSTDTRNIHPGALFVALLGERFDAHEFLDNAIAKGAAGVVVNQPVDISVPQWVVEDTTSALGHIACRAREDFSGALVAITGSSGKTTVKEMLQAILRTASGEVSVFATKGNLNNHIGVPLSILSLSKAHRYAVIEMGASAVGEIQYLSHMAKPNVAMVNNVMPAHIEGFGSLENIATGKGEIYDGLSDDGVAVINIDDQFSPQWLEKNQHRKIVTFSMVSESIATVNANSIRCNELGCPTFSMAVAGEEVEVSLQILGQHNVANALAAAACAYALDISPSVIAKGLAEFVPVDGRLNTFVGFQGATIIDDSYNANPGSVKAAIDVLSDMNGLTVLVLGDMAELGEYAEQEHRNLGEHARCQKIDVVMTLGELAGLAADSFGDHGMQFSDSEQLISAARELADSQTFFLVKGSRSSRMDRIVDALKKRGEHHATLVS